MTDDASRGWPEWPHDPAAPVVLMSVRTIDGECYIKAEEAHAAVRTARQQGRDHASAAHTAALAAAGAAGEARGIERAAVWHAAKNAEMVGQDRPGEANVQAAMRRVYAVWHADAAASIRALSPSASPALDAVVERARRDEREANIAWAVGRWRAEVDNRPMANIDRPPLDRTWRQVMRQFGGDPVALVGPDPMEAAAIRARGEKGEG